MSAIVQKNQPAGSYEYTFNAGDIPSGIYFYRLHAVTRAGSETTLIRKMTLIK